MTAELILAIGTLLNFVLAIYNIQRYRTRDTMEASKLAKEVRKINAETDKADVETAMLLLAPLREEVTKLRAETQALAVANVTIIKENAVIVEQLKTENAKLARAVERLLVTVATLRECIVQLIAQIEHLGAKPVVELPPIEEV